jgi:hypothetical protein
MPLAEVLERVASMAFIKVRRRRICLTLSAAMAPPFVYRVPPEVTRWTEAREIARAGAAHLLAVKPELVECRQDARHPGLAAAVSRSLLLQVRGWAESHGARIASIKPLWAVATQCRASSKSSIDGIAMLEPDGACLIMGLRRNTSPPVVHVWDGAEPAIELNIASSVREAGASVDRVLQLGFGAEMRSATPGYPNYLPRHWYQR